MKELIFNEAEKATTVTFEQLQESRPLAGFNGKFKKSKPLPHFDYITLIKEMITEHSEVELAPIYVAKNSLYRVALKKEEANLVQNIVINDLVTGFKIINHANPEMSLMIALGYNQKGVTAAIGANISICSNMTICGQGNYLQTYGRNSVPYEELIRLISVWISELNHKWVYYNDMIHKMKAISLTSDTQVPELIGKLQLMAVNQSYMSNNDISPFNIGEVSAYSKALLNNQDFLNNEPISLWDLVNIGTDIITHSETNIHEKYFISSAFGDYIINNYIN